MYPKIHLCGLIHDAQFRLAFSVLRVDAYLSVLTGHPPSLRFQELRIPLSKPADLWNAADEEKERRLRLNEPPGREKMLHCLLMRDILDHGQQAYMSYNLTAADYHLILCSLWTGVWEAAREAHSCDIQELNRFSKTNDNVQVWHTRLEEWRASVEKHHLLRQSYFSPSNPHDDILAPHSLLLWHISALTLHAPLEILQGRGCCSTCRTDPATTSQKTTTRIRTWSKTVNARIAVWNAAQISRIILLESTRTSSTTHFKLNPLAMSGLLKSAIVICSYASHTRVCPVCTGGPPIDIVDVIGGSDEDERLVRWIYHAEGLADWPPLDGPVCRCKVGALAAWFRPFVATDRKIEAEFVSFMDGLMKG